MIHITRYHANIGLQKRMYIRLSDSWVRLVITSQSSFFVDTHYLPDKSHEISFI